MSGLDSDGLKKLNSSSEGSQHINKLLRVLTVRTEAGKEKSGIMLVGGPHDPKIDGSATQRYIPTHCWLVLQLCAYMTLCSLGRSHQGRLRQNLWHVCLLLLCSMEACVGSLLSG